MPGLDSFQWGVAIVFSVIVVTVIILFWNTSLGGDLLSMISGLGGGG